MQNKLLASYLVKHTTDRVSRAVFCFPFFSIFKLAAFLVKDVRMQNLGETSIRSSPMMLILITFLFINLARITKSHFSSLHHFGFEAVAVYVKVSPNKCELTYR